jgi:hypothetical protein
LGPLGDGGSGGVSSSGVVGVGIHSAASGDSSGAGSGVSVVTVSDGDGRRGSVRHLVERPLSGRTSPPGAPPRAPPRSPRPTLQQQPSQRKSLWTRDPELKGSQPSCVFVLSAPCRSLLSRCVFAGFRRHPAWSPLARVLQLHVHCMSRLLMVIIEVSCSVCMELVLVRVLVTGLIAVGTCTL